MMRGAISEPKFWVLFALVLVAIWFSTLWLRWLQPRRLPAPSAGERDAGRIRPGAVELAIGVVTDFLDTLGISSFATTTSLFRLRGLVPDRLIPGTLNVGHMLPTVAQALIYISIIEVDWVTLLAMIAASALGAFFGAGRVSRWPERKLRIGMGSALLCAGGLMLARALGVMPPGGEAKALSGVLLAAGVLGNFALGALMTLGIGLYAPCMVLVALLGMDPKAAFPIMMGSCAFLMPVASARFIPRASYSPRAALGLTIGGVPAVLVAAYVVKELPLNWMRWLVVCVVSYTGVMLLRAAARDRGVSAAPRPA